MIRTKLVAVAVAALLLTAGVAAAAPGDAPDVGSGDHAKNATGNASDDAAEPDAAVGNGSAVDGERPDEAAAPADSAGERGPPAALPDAVPEHVRQIHDLIQQHLAGSLDGSLGEAISDLMGGADDDGAESG